MADTYTTNLNLTKPEPDVSLDWGTKLNSDLDTIDAIFSATGTQVDVNLNSANFGDNKKALFGASNDLQIYHDGTHSYIKDAGTGRLKIIGNDQVRLENTDGDAYLAAVADGSTFLYYAGSNKLGTTSTGIDVTGTVVADGLTVSGDALFSGNVTLNGDAGETIKIVDSTETNGYQIKANVSSTADFGLIFEDLTGKDLLKIQSNNDISFYEDTGTTAKLFWDASAERLGIGTTSPSAELSVSNGGVEGYEISPATVIGGTIRQLAFNRSTSNYMPLRTQASEHQFYVSGSERMRIDSSGNVGIGTTSPGRQLVVSNSGNAELELYSGTTSSGFVYFRDSGDSNIGALQYNHNGNYMAFRVNDAERVRIDSSGNVGIGTSSPDSILHIASETNGTNTFTMESLDAFLSVGQVANAINFNTNDGSATGVTSKIAQISENGNEDLALAFSTFNGTLNEAMRIDENGNVGIGTTSPSQKLHVDSGDALIKSTYDASGTTNAYMYFASRAGGNWRNSTIGNTGSNLIFSTGGVGTTHSNATEAMRIDSSGNVGIGTSSPNYTLQVHKPSDSTVRFQITNSNTGSGTADGFQIIQNGSSQSNKVNLLNYENSALGIWTNNAERLHITASGNVGIGTTSPNTALHVSSAVTTKSVVETTGAASDALIEFTRGQGSGNTWSIGLDQSNSSALSFAYQAAASPSLTTHGVVTIDTSGNVGIGTSSPAHLLHLSAADPRIQLTDTTTNVDHIINANSSVGNLTIDVDANAEGSGPNLIIDIANSERMRIDSSGNVMVGTTDTDPSNNASGTGVAISSDGRIFTGGLSASQFNRIGSDGNIVNFRKGGTTVGSIGVNSNIYLAGTTSGLRVRANDVIPVNATGGGNDNALDLGISTQRWKDLYLSGGVYVGGTAAANQLDDYEEGTWTATLPQGGNAIFQANTYTKVGRLVTVYCQFRGNSTPNNGNTFQVGNLPFAAAAGSQYGSVSCARGFPSVAKSIVAYCTGSVFQFRAVPHNSSGGGLGDLLNSDLTGYTNDFDISFAVTYMTSS